MKRCRLKPGKRTLAWEQERAKLKVKFLSWGITSCEATFPHECWHDNGLSFAHARKRRNLKRHELQKVALLCINAHTLIELMREDDMCRIVEEIIATREQRLEKIKKVEEFN